MTWLDSVIHVKKNMERLAVAARWGSGAASILLAVEFFLLGNNQFIGPWFHYNEMYLGTMGWLDMIDILYTMLF